MPTVVCAVCGDADVLPRETACPTCGAVDRDHVIAPPPRDPDARLLARVEEALRALREVDGPAPDELRARLTAQAAVLEARMRARHDARDRALLDYALARVRRELQTAGD